MLGPADLWVCVVRLLCILLLASDLHGFLQCKSLSLFDCPDKPPLPLSSSALLHRFRRAVQPGTSFSGNISRIALVFIDCVLLQVVFVPFQIPIRQWAVGSRSTSHGCPSNRPSQPCPPPLQVRGGTYRPQWRGHWSEPRWCQRSGRVSGFKAACMNGFISKKLPLIRPGLEKKEQIMSWIHQTSLK